MAFDTSKSIILELERMIAQEKSSIFTAFEFFRRELFYPVKLLIKGFDVFSRDIIKFSILVFFGLIAMTWITLELTKADAGALALFVYPFVFLLPLVVSMFSAPSSYSFCGVKDDHLNLVFARLANSGVRNIEQLAPVKSNILQFESRVRVRIIGLRAFMVLCWTGFVYLYSEFNNIIIESGHMASMADVSFASFILFASFLGVLGLYLAIESYSKANTLLFRAALFGCNEYEYALAEEVCTNESFNKQINENTDSASASSAPVI